MSVMFALLADTVSRKRSECALLLVPLLLLLLPLDQTADAVIVECSHHESVARQGRIRTQGYLMRQVGTVLGGLMGSVLYDG